MDIPFLQLDVGTLLLLSLWKILRIDPPLSTLKWVYYAPKLAFTLVSVARLDKAGCSLTIEDSECQICSPRPYCTILGHVPWVNKLQPLLFRFFGYPRFWTPKTLHQRCEWSHLYQQSSLPYGTHQFPNITRESVKVPLKVLNWIHHRHPCFVNPVSEEKPITKLSQKLTRPSIRNMVKRLQLTFGVQPKSNLSEVTLSHKCSRTYTPANPCCFSKSQIRSVQILQRIQGLGKGPL
jgi:hypothetical protein